MRRILKFSLVPGVTLHVPVGPDSKVLHVAEQPHVDPHSVKVWIECAEPESDGAMRPGSEVVARPEVIRHFTIFATGDTVPDRYIHRGTAVCSGGRFIWHLYELP